MIALDTNVLLRLVVNDDSAQAERAHRLVAERCTPDTPAYVSTVAMVELAWVLQDTFKRTKSQTIELFDRILRLSDIAVDTVAEAAVEQWRWSRADYADHVIGTLGRGAGCEATVTFDRQASETSDFMAVP